MNNVYYNGHPLKPFEQWFKKCFPAETRREFLFPQPLDIALERLRTAFVSPIRFSKGYWSLKSSLHGSLDERLLQIEVFVSVAGRKSAYSVQGQLVKDPQGSRLELVLLEKNMFTSVLIYAILVIASFPKGGIPVMLFYTVGFLLAQAVGRDEINQEADKIGSLLNKIIMGRTLSLHNELTE